jgi:hypothetical protein
MTCKRTLPTSTGSSSSSSTRRTCKAIYMAVQLQSIRCSSAESGNTA